MKDPKQQVSQSRRKFLRDASVTGGVAAVAVGAPGLAAADNVADGTTEKPVEGYRLTEHILAYYKSAAS